MDPRHLERRCPRLGGDVPFDYCCACEAGKRPCFKVLDCWWERFDVVAYMKARLSPENFAVLATRHAPPNKVGSLVDLIRQAQERASEG